jgi:hypothetical protein
MSVMESKKGKLMLRIASKGGGGGEARSTGCQGWIKVMTLYLMEIRVHTRQSKLWPFI